MGRIEEPEDDLPEVEEKLPVHVVQIESMCDQVVTAYPKFNFPMCPICLSIPDRDGLWVHRGWDELYH